MDCPLTMRTALRSCRRFNWSIGSTEDHHPGHVLHDAAADFSDWAGLARCRRIFLWTSLFSLTAAAASGSDDVHIAAIGRLTGPFEPAMCESKFETLKAWGQHAHRSERSGHYRQWLGFP
eukprot:1680049-Prymnesium_polylepis.2